MAKASARQLKTNTVFDSEGKEIVVEEREDTEAKTKFQETLDLLVAAGEISRVIKHESAPMFVQCACYFLMISIFSTMVG